jgi:hypothetical protein
MLSWYYDREVKFSVRVFDKYDQFLDACSDSIVIPGPKEMLCSTQATTPVLWISDEGRCDPDSIRCTLTVYNSLDSMRRCHGAWIDQSRLKYLKPTEVDMIYRPAFDVPPRGNAAVSWTLAVAQPQTNNVTEQVLMFYTPLPDRKWESCSADVEIRPHAPRAFCQIILPDSILVTESGGPVTFRVPVHLSNDGTLPLTMGGVLLEADSLQGLHVLDTGLRSVSVLPPGGRDTLYWDVQAVRVRANTSAWLRARMFNTALVELHSCESATIVRGMGSSLACSIDTPDSLHFNAALGTYDPEKLLLRVNVRNLLDLPVEEVRVRLETAGMGRLVPAPGTIIEITGINLPPRGSADFAWTLIPLIGGQISREYMFVALRAKGDPEWTGCRKDIYLDAVNLTRGLTCAASGHDTLWSDMDYERMIPVPVQLQYSLTNSGTARLELCSVAIVLPSVLRLVAAQDSIQEYGTLAPGETVRREWLCDIVESALQPGGQSISWIAACEDFTPGVHCNHTLTVVPTSPVGLVLTPWYLRYQAEQHGSLPAAQTVTVWTGGGPGPIWTATTTPSWLDAAPLSSTGRTEMLVQPNSTALTLGNHSGAVIFTPLPLSTGPLQVAYTITSTTEIEAVPDEASIRLHALYPQPLSSDNSLVVEYSLAVPQSVSLEVRDLLGRLLFDHHEFVASAGKQQAVISVGSMRPGIYLLTLIGVDKVQTQSFLVVDSR